MKRQFKTIEFLDVVIKPMKSRLRFVNKRLVTFLRNLGFLSLVTTSNYTYHFSPLKFSHV